MAPVTTKAPSAFQILDQIKDEIAAVRAKREQIAAEAERWRPLDDE